MSHAGHLVRDNLVTELTDIGVKPFKCLLRFVLFKKLFVGGTMSNKIPMEKQRKKAAERE
jgi:hypothetical protein